MGIWSLITGAGKVGDVVDTGLGLIEAGAKGIDVLFDTSEEQRADAMQSRREMFSHALKANAAANSGNTISSITRRILAFSITGTVLLSFFWCVAVTSYAHIKGGVEARAMASGIVKDVILLVDVFYIGEAFAGVIGVYFVYYGVKKALNK